tara:strand:- start:582 stop:764 length:183 start_codon:yes stop_codon:yes gene_type:complete
MDMSIGKKIVKGVMKEHERMAQSEFGMSYDQLGANEQEWVRDTFLDIRCRQFIEAANDSC